MSSCARSIEGRRMGHPSGARVKPESRNGATELKYWGYERPTRKNDCDSGNSCLSNVRHVQFIEFVGLLAFMLCSFSLVAGTVVEIDERQRPKSYQNLRRSHWWHLSRNIVQDCCDIPGK